MAVATTTPTTLDEPRVAYEPIAIPRATPRWGPPIWAADDLVATPDRRSVSQIDIMTLSMVLAYKPD